MKNSDDVVIVQYESQLIMRGLELGEGCLWDAKRQAVHFIDISRFILYTYYVESKKMEQINLGDYIGCIVLDEKNQIIAAVRNKLVRVNIENGTTEVICILDLPEGIRFNDGKCDQYGNLWVGTIAIEYGPDKMGLGELYCIKENRVIAKYDGFSIPNGLDWSLDGTKFFHIDTATGNINKYCVEGECRLINPQVVVKAESSTDGSPDGMCMDEEGNFWTAKWDGNQVACYNAKTGEKIAQVLLPDPMVTCCVFGGTDLMDLYITTAQDKEMGGLYVVKNIGSKGKLPQLYRG